MFSFGDVKIICNVMTSLFNHVDAHQLFEQLFRLWFLKTIVQTIQIVWTRKKKIGLGLGTSLGAIRGKIHRVWSKSLQVSRSSKPPNLISPLRRHFDPISPLSTDFGHFAEIRRVKSTQSLQVLSSFKPLNPISPVRLHLGPISPLRSHFKPLSLISPVRSHLDSISVWKQCFGHFEERSKQDSKSDVSAKTIFWPFRGEVAAQHHEKRNMRR